LKDLKVQKATPETPVLRAFKVLKATPETPVLRAFKVLKATPETPVLRGLRVIPETSVLRVQLVLREFKVLKVIPETQDLLAQPEQPEQQAPLDPLVPMEFLFELSTTQPLDRQGCKATGPSVIPRPEQVQLCLTCGITLLVRQRVRHTTRSGLTRMVRHVRPWVNLPMSG
jgi:hypothetical protein